MMHRSTATVRALLIAVLAAVALVQALIILSAGDAQARRAAAERSQFVCLDGDRIAQGARFTTCRRIVWRLAEAAR